MPLQEKEEEKRKPWGVTSRSTPADTKAVSKAAWCSWLATHGGPPARLGTELHSIDDKYG
jgi:hypothetical protein